MALLRAPSEAVRQIARALNLPEKTVAFTLRVRAGEIATIEVEMYAGQIATEDLATVLKHFRLQEIEDQNAKPAALGAQGQR